MTLQAFYPLVGGDWEEVLHRFPSESMVHRFVTKFRTDSTYSQLCDAVRAQDWEAAFRASHTLKGVAQNLGFDDLYRSAYTLTEDLRDLTPLSNHQLLDAVSQDYGTLMAAIGQLD